MFLIRSYYHIKPFLPHRARLAVRRWRAEWRRRHFAAEWPIKLATAAKPPGWRGWPEGKKFAFVLTHDVEGTRGLEQCRAIADLERARGLRSSFNFIPEGDYRVSPELRDYLCGNGFEVGVHDLKHNGKLYLSRATFLRHAQSINRYLREWNAVGFRSGFMHHNLDWLRELDVLYDSSTFDTDPFEPQPDGVDTIFPFWVPAPPQPSTLNPQPSASPKGYIELPYTLPQDFTLFLVLQEKTIDVWKQKIDWLAEQGGMAMIDVHPDYVDLKGSGQAGVSYPLRFYTEFLDYVQQKYAGQFWQALPREVAQFAKDGLLPRIADPKPETQNSKLEAPSPALATPRSALNRRRQKVWIDLDNTPHVPFFEPIIEELSQRGFDVVLTARDAFQVCELADQKGLRYAKIGRHHGRSKIIKAIGLFGRAFELLPFVLREKPDLALSHGARSQIIIANLLRIPTMLIEDYEFAQYPPLMRPTWEMVPDVIPDSSLCCAKERVRKYPGIKEDVYVGRMKRDPNFRSGLGISADDMLITVRPPATEAHYHNFESEDLFARFMDHACTQNGVRIVLLPRNARQGDAIKSKWPKWFAGSRTLIPGKAVDGLNLVWHSDLVVSGGGTMIREAAALGVPVYSVFRGPIGAVDRALQKQGRVVLIESPDDISRKVRFVRRDRSASPASNHNIALIRITDQIQTILQDGAAATACLSAVSS